MTSQPIASRFPAEIYRARLDRARELAAARGLSALVIGTGDDFLYLLGSRAHSYERLTALVIPTYDAPPTIVVPRMELAALRDSPIDELGLTVRDWVDGMNPYEIVMAAAGTKLAVDPAMPALHLITLTELTSRPAVLATPVLRELRMVKDGAEIAALRRAGQAIDRVHARMGDWLRVGRKESEVAADIAEAIVAEGHTAPEFIIVGSGPNGADPHQEVTERVLQSGDVVVIDIGGPVEPGYNSDSTRTYCLGEPSAEIAEQYAVLQRAQQAAVDHARPGVSAESVDAAARSVLAEAGLADAFVHRTGHGIGLSVHEEPYIVAGNPMLLEEGMAFSIEPGIYFPGNWGARIEDIVVLTADGCERLNNRPHELGILPG